MSDKTAIDTRAALWSAIDAYGCDATQHGALGLDGTTRANLDRALAAHVEAEVARRLAAAPEVEAALDSLSTEHCISTYEFDPLLAAIAADKTRAVAAAGRVDVRLLHDALRYVTAWGNVSGGSEEWKARNQDRVEDELRAAIQRGLDGGDAPARPTHDEARRLVDAYGRECELRASERDPSARTDLLRALGVEP